MSTPVNPALDDIPERLTKAATEVESTRAAHKDALERRNELIETAVDHGMTQRAIAKMTGLTTAAITGILLRQAAG